MTDAEDPRRAGTGEAGTRVRDVLADARGAPVGLQTDPVRPRPGEDVRVGAAVPPRGSAGDPPVLGLGRPAGPGSLQDGFVPGVGFDPEGNPGEIPGQPAEAGEDQGAALDPDGADRADRPALPAKRGERGEGRAGQRVGDGGQAGRRLMAGTIPS